MKLCEDGHRFHEIAISQSEPTTSIERCRREISAIEMTIRAGHPDLRGLCLALSDWWGELRMIEQEMGLRRTEAAATQSGARTGLEEDVTC
jgi:hypothetical protein